MTNEEEERRWKVSVEDRLARQRTLNFWSTCGWVLLGVALLLHQCRHQLRGLP